MKKIIFLSLALSAMCLSACAGNDSSYEKSKQDKECITHANTVVIEDVAFLPVCNFDYNMIFIAPLPLVIADLNFEQPVPAVIGVPDTKRHFAYLFATVQKKC